MTNGDRIRQMTDEELAQMFEQIISQRDHWWLKKLICASNNFELIEAPSSSVKQHLSWLKEENQE